MEWTCAGHVTNPKALALVNCEPVNNWNTSVQTKLSVMHTGDLIKWSLHYCYSHSSLSAGNYNNFVYTLRFLMATLHAVMRADMKLEKKIFYRALDNATIIVASHLASRFSYWNPKSKHVYMQLPLLFFISAYAGERGYWGSNTLLAPVFVEPTEVEGD